MSKKIPFNVKFRPQIESGEYKVVYVENSSSEQCPVEILKWDSNSDAGCIIGCVRRKGKDKIYAFQENGVHTVSDEDDRLFLVTPEPEMSEFEKALDDTIRSYRCDSEKDEDGGILDYQSWIKRKATSLLDLAKSQLLQSGELLTQEHHEKLMETLLEEYKKDLPRWRNVEADKRYVGCVTRYMDVNGDWNYCMSSGKLSDDCQYISIVALEKLPKEESHE